MRAIDAHVHLNGDDDDWIAMLERLDLLLVNVCVAADDKGSWREGRAAFRDLAERYPERYAWCTTFDPPTFDDRDYAERAIAELERDTQAVGCKMWKNIGMEVRKPSGEFVLPDDPVFEPIYAHLARTGRTLLMHIGEPRACWMPLDPQNLHYGYYYAHPEWHMFGRSEYPSHQDLVDARDQVVAGHPGLRVVGAHLGSLEYDVGEIARRLELYPNFAVDTSARTRDLAVQDRDTVRSFFERYSDRVLFGTDIVLRERQSDLERVDRLANIEQITERYQTEFAYYEQDGAVTYRGLEVRGLGLPESVLAKFYVQNAAAWYGGFSVDGPRQDR